ncbi:ATP-dependent protein binding protein [Histomonas meleagridis]|uniref:ATP-dependent protein binding protein n=1 Tax=Histomonas meleagridis TaxID=135588 RepID=UPI00355949F3|nr:ATP-dependent protein binding protein [Histomonas meleagridis]KAH0804672.1 ATP-dependent protein binding protein [Histomonas meleagridis]
MLFVKFREITFPIACNLEENVFQLKARIQEEMLVASDLQLLVFRGKQLNNQEVLSKIGICEKSTVYMLTRKSASVVNVIFNNDYSFKILINLTSPISQIRRMISNKTQLKAEQLKISFKGKNINSNDFSLSYFGIQNEDTLTCEIVNTPRRREKPAELVRKLAVLLAQIQEGKTNKQRELIEQITELINNRTLESFALIDSFAQQLISDATRIINLFETDCIDVNVTIATMNDVVYSQIESNNEGMRIFESIHNLKKDQSISLFEEAPLKTNLDYEPQISTTPLPCCTRDPYMRIVFPKLLDPNSYDSIQARFSHEIEELKKMGFKDEKVIIMALRETSGNISEALKKLNGRL